MKKLRRSLSVFLVAVMCVGIFSACGNNAATSQVFVYGTAQEPGSLNPDALDEPYGYSIYQNIFNRLVKSTNSFEIVPDLADSWSFSDDGLELTFSLHKGVKWHDGIAFTSADVKWTFDTIVSAHGYAEASFANVEEILCPNDNTVVFRFKKPDASILSVLSRLGVFIMPMHIYDGTDWLNNAANQKPIGTGPFVFKEWVAGESITLQRNDQYFGDIPKLDKAVFKFIPDENTAYMSWINKEIDWYDSYPAAEVEKLKNNNEYVVIEKPTANVTYITFNMNREPFSNKAVREAISLSIDKNEILKKAFQGVGVIADSYIPPVYEDYLKKEYSTPDRDIAKARDILEKAGYVANDDGYYLDIDFEYFSLDCFEDIAILLKAQLKEAGINLKLNLIEYATWQEKVFNNRDFSMTMMNGNQGPTVFSTIARYDPDNATCISGYNSNDMRALINNAISSTNHESELKAFADIQKLLSEDLPIVPIVEKVEFVPLRANIHGHPLNDSISKASADELTYVYFS